MKLLLKIVLILFLFTKIGLSYSVIDYSSLCNNKKLEVIIVATADLHAKLTSWNYSYGNFSNKTSLSRIFTLVKNYRQKSPLILIDAGDFLQGSPITSMFANKFPTFNNPVISAMNIMRYDVIVPGNHEFDFGKSYFFHCVKKSNADFICANLVNKNTNSLIFPPYKVISILNNKLRICIVGFTCPSTKNWIPEEFIPSLQFNGIIRSAKKFIPGLKKRLNCQLLIAVIHSGLGPEPEHKVYNKNEIILTNCGYKLADTFSEIDVVIMAHTHRKILMWYKNKKQTLLLQPRNNAKDIAVIKAGFILNKHKADLSYLKGNILEITEAVPEEVNIVKSQKLYKLLTENRLKQRLAYLKDNVNESFTPLKDCGYVDLINSAQLYFSKADISLAPPPIRKFKAENYLTKRDIYRLYPFENKLVTLKLKGKKLVALLKQVYSKISIKNNIPSLKIPYYLFLMPAGVSITFNPFSKIKKLKIFHKKQPISNNKYYTIVTNSYLTNKNGPYKILGNAEKLYMSKKGIREIIIDYVKLKGKLSISPDNNYKPLLQKLSVNQ